MPEAEPHPAASAAHGLEPLSLGAIGDRAAELYRTNFLPLFSIAMLPDVAVYVVLISFILASQAMEDPSVAGGTYALGMTLAVVFGLVAGVFRHGALAWAASECYFGRPASPRRAFAAAGRGWARIFASWVLGYVLIGLAFLVGIVPGVVVAIGLALMVQDPLVGAVLAVMGFIPFLGLGFYLFLRFLFAVFPPVVPLLEKQWAFGALQRSARLMTYADPGWGHFKRNAYRATGLFLLLFGIFWAVTFIGQLPNAALAVWHAVEQIRSGIPTSADPTLAAPLYLLIPAQILALLAQSLAFPYTVAVLVIFYWDLRVRREGYGFFYELGLEEEARA